MADQGLNARVTMKINLTSVLLDDQDKALRFYTEILGFRKKIEIPVGKDRWLTVVSPADPDGTELVLEPDSYPAVGPFKQAWWPTVFRSPRSLSTTFRRSMSDSQHWVFDLRNSPLRWDQSRWPLSMTPAAILSRLPPLRNAPGWRVSAIVALQSGPVTTSEHNRRSL